MKLLALLAIVAAFGAQAQNGRNSREFLQGNLPFVGSYWESYLKYQTRPDDCLDISTPRPPDDSPYFGYILAETPPEVQVVYIAFGNTQPRGCYEHCEPYVCGLHLYGVAGVDEAEYDDFKKDIAALQAKGHTVLLAYGGEEYGNVIGDVGALKNDMVAAVNDLGLDGVEIVFEEGCGFWHESCGQTPLHVLHLIRM